MLIRFEKEGRIRRIVIELDTERVIIESDPPEPLLDIPLGETLLTALKKWLAAQDGVKELKDE